MFDFTLVGICIALAGVAFLTFAWRLLPQDRKGAASMDAAFILEGYTAEARVPKVSPTIDRTVRQLEAMGTFAR
jgi:di/tricarboxylate transporter